MWLSMIGCTPTFIRIFRGLATIATIYIYISIIIWSISTVLSLNNNNLILLWLLLLCWGQHIKYNSIFLVISGVWNIVSSVYDGLRLPAVRHRPRIHPQRHVRICVSCPLLHVCRSWMWVCHWFLVEMDVGCDWLSVEMFMSLRM